MIKRDPLNFLSDLSNRSEKIIKIYHLGQPIYIINSPEGVEHVLVKANKHFSKGHFYNKVKPLFGKGLPVLEGEEWKRHKKLMQPSFHKQQLEHISELAIGCSEQLVEKWKTEAPLDIDVDADMARLTLDVVA